jgi:hypothetical protein
MRYTLLLHLLVESILLVSIAVHTAMRQGAEHAQNRQMLTLFMVDSLFTGTNHHALWS